MPLVETPNKALSIIFQVLTRACSVHIPLLSAYPNKESSMTSCCMPDPCAAHKRAARHGASVQMLKLVQSCPPVDLSQTLSLQRFHISIAEGARSLGGVMIPGGGYADMQGLPSLR